MIFRILGKKASLEYVTSLFNSKNQLRGKVPRLLRGNLDLAQERIKKLELKGHGQPYTSSVATLKGKEIEMATPWLLERIMDMGDFYLQAGQGPDAVDTVWILHDETDPDTGEQRLELHGLTSQMDGRDESSYKVYYAGKDLPSKDALQDVLNLTYDLNDPKGVKYKAGHNIGKSIVHRTGSKDFRERIYKDVEAGVESGKITRRSGVIKAILKLDIEIKRVCKTGIAVIDPERREKDLKSTKRKKPVPEDKAGVVWLSKTPFQRGFNPEAARAIIEAEKKDAELRKKRIAKELEAARERFVKQMAYRIKRADDRFNRPKKGQEVKEPTQEQIKRAKKYEQILISDPLNRIGEIGSRVPSRFAEVRRDIQSTFGPDGIGPEAGVIRDEAGDGREIEISGGSQEPVLGSSEINRLDEVGVGAETRRDRLANLPNERRFGPSELKEQYRKLLGDFIKVDGSGGKAGRIDQEALEDREADGESREDARELPGLRWDPAWRERVWGRINEAIKPLSPVRAPTDVEPPEPPSEPPLRAPVQEAPDQSPWGDESPAVLALREVVQPKAEGYHFHPLAKKAFGFAHPKMDLAVQGCIENAVLADRHGSGAQAAVFLYHREWGYLSPQAFLTFSEARNNSPDKKVRKYSNDVLDAHQAIVDLMPAEQRQTARKVKEKEKTKKKTKTKRPVKSLGLSKKAKKRGREKSEPTLELEI